MLCPLAALPSSKKRVQQPVGLCALMLWRVSCLREVATQTPYLEKKKTPVIPRIYSAPNQVYSGRKEVDESAIM